jgi:hypothetical protein
MNQYLVAVIFFFSFAIFAQGQSANEEDIIYLKNGGVTRGTIIEIIPDKTVKIQIAGGSVFVYNFTEIDKLVKRELKAQAPVPPIAPKTIEKSKFKFKKQQFCNMVRVGPIGFSSYGMNVIRGYQFNRYLFLGLGVGLDAYRGIADSDNADLFSTDQSTGTAASANYFLPIFVDFRFYLRKSKTTFFIFVDAGYSPYLGGNYENIQINPNATISFSYYGKPTGGGILYCPGLGFKTSLTENVGLFIDLGLKVQTYNAILYTPDNTSYPYNQSPPYTYTSEKSFGASLLPTINFGVIFK